jgi:hypothetical protein
MPIKIKKLSLRLLMIIENILPKQLMITKNLFKNPIKSIMIEMYIRANHIMINIIIMNKIIKFLKLVNLKIRTLQVTISKTNKIKCNSTVKVNGSRNRRLLQLIGKLFMLQDPKVILITRMPILRLIKVAKGF